MSSTPNDTAIWFAKKKAQLLRQQGNHPVPGTKAKADHQVGEEVVAGSSGKVKVMDRGKMMILMSKKDSIVESAESHQEVEETETKEEEHVKS